MADDGRESHKRAAENRGERREARGGSFFLVWRRKALLRRCPLQRVGQVATRTCRSQSSESAALAPWLNSSLAHRLGHLAQVLTDSQAPASRDMFNQGTRSVHEQYAAPSLDLH